MATIRGTRGGDAITGTEETDRLYGLGGDDTIQTAGLGDWMYGGPGNDLLVSGNQSTSALYGESGNDILQGGAFGEEMSGGSGDDIVYGGGGNDRIWSEERLGSDIIHGEDGNDSIRVTRRYAGSTIEVYGGGGADTIALEIRAGNTIQVDAGEGDDVVSVLALWATSELGASGITLGGGRDTLVLTGYNTGAVYSRATIADFETGAGGDFIDFLSLLRVYTSFGWAYSVNPFTAGFARLEQSGADTLLQFASTANGSFATAVVFKNVQASAFTSENLGVSPTGQAEAGRVESGGAEADLLIGGAGDDTLTALGGRDRLFGGDGADSLDGGEGDDTLDGGFGNDMLQGGAGRDTLVGGGGDDAVHGGDDADTLRDSENGTDTLHGDGGDDYLSMSRIGSGSVAMFGGEGSDQIIVSGWAAGGVTIDGGGGDDTILLNSVTGTPDRPAGKITITTGAGRDLVEISAPVHSTNAPAIEILDFTVGAGGDRIDMAAYFRIYAYGFPAGANPFATGHARLLQSGADTLLQFAVNGASNGFVTVATLRDTAASAFTSANFDGFSPDGAIAAPLALSGGDGADTFTGDGGGDTIDGLGGDDRLYGLSGTDTLRGGDGHDTLEGGSGNDLLEGGEGNDSLRGGVGNDVMQGGGGHDYIDAFDGGSDRLHGGEGNDTLSASSSSATDHFILEGGAGSDALYLSLWSGGTYALDAGAGRDTVYIRSMAGTGTIALGADADILRLTANMGGSGTITLTDFEAGDGGDAIDFDEWLASDLIGYDSALNPFDTGHLRLVESGANVILQRDMNGGGDSFVNWITFQNTAIWALTDFNFDGYAIPNRIGTGTAASERFQGASGSDNFVGGGGQDLFLIGYGGSDRAIGGGGADTFFVALRAGGSDSHVVDGAGGSDLLQLQGRGPQAVVALGASPVSGNLLDIASVEKVQLLSGFDTSRGWGEGSAIEYRIHLQDTATQSGALFTLDASGLAAGERLLFDTAETNAPLHLLGGAGSDEMAGGALGDVLDGGAGADLLTGGLGDDIYIVDDLFDQAVESAGEGIDEVRTSLSTYSLLGAQIENLTATSDFAHEFRGNSAANVLTGGDGNDFLLLQEGGEDTAFGGNGNDIIYFGSALSAGDVAVGGGGRDAVVLQGNVTAVLTDSHLAGIESISLQSGANTRFGDTANNFYDFNLTMADGNLAAGQQLIVNAQSLRSGEDFTFDGSAESDGKFVVYGGHGVDNLTGGEGVDVFFFEGQRWGATDRVDGGGGRDSLVISAGSGLAQITFAADSFTNIESISLNNRFATDPSQKPSYELVLHNGNVAPGGMLIVNGSSIPGGQLVNIDGRGVHDGNLILFGGGGHDTLFGGDGADLILGGGGADGLTGGAGADTFRYDSASDSLAGLSDVIGDFASGSDRIDLSRVDANANAAGDQAFTWIGANAFSGSAGELRTHDSGGYRWIEGDTDGDGDGDLVIALQVGPVPLVQTDFLL